MKKILVPNSPKSVNLKESMSAQQTPYRDYKKLGRKEVQKNADLKKKDVKKTPNTLSNLQSP